VVTCANLFCTFLHKVNGLILPSSWTKKTSNMEHDEELVGVYLRGSNDVTIDLGRDSLNLLVEGELESLLERTSQVFDFTLSPEIMRLPEIPCKNGSCTDRQEETLAFMMLTHVRLGESSVLHHLSEHVLEFVVKKAMARPWGIFRRDVYFEDFLGLVARHINAKIQRQQPHKIVLLKHSSSCVLKPKNHS